MPILEALEYGLVGVAILMGQFTDLSLFTGGVVAFIGAVFLMWAAGHARPGKLEGGDVSGPWRFVRHPETSARFLLIFGVMLIARVPSIFAISIVILGYLYRKSVKAGDQELKKWLGPGFAMYKLLTPSFLPQFLPAKLPQYTMRVTIQSSPWSIKRALRRRESVWAAGIYLGTILWLYGVKAIELNSWYARLFGLLLLFRGCWCLWKMRSQNIKTLEAVIHNIRSIEVNAK